MIYVAYDNALIYSNNGEVLYPYPNLMQYKPYAPWNFDYEKICELENELNITFPIKIEKNEIDAYKILSGQKLELSPIYAKYNSKFIHRTLDELYDTSDDFIYPVIIPSLDFFRRNKISKFDLPLKLIECLHQNRAKLVFIQLFEGVFGTANADYFFFIMLSNKYNLKKEQLIMVTTNLKAAETFDDTFSKKLSEQNFTIYPYSFFHYFNHWPLIMYDMNNFILNNRTNKKSYHFLSLNRRCRLHRLAIFAELMINDKLKNKSILSLSKVDTTNADNKYFYNCINHGISDSYSYNKKRLLDFYESYNSNIDYKYDDYESHYVLNDDAQKNTFLSIVTETDIENNMIFFSEKIFKPIYTCQPFVLLGNPGSLQKLKELGFKTFDKWWDESYDCEEDFTKRFEKVVTILEEISSWSLEKCFDITNEMESTFLHNFDILIKNNETKKLLKFLSDGKKLI